MATAAKARRTTRAATPAPRVTVTSLPSLDPVRAHALDPFWDTLFRVAQRVAVQSTATPVAA